MNWHTLNWYIIILIVHNVQFWTQTRCLGSQTKIIIKLRSDSVIYLGDRSCSWNSDQNSTQTLPGDDGVVGSRRGWSLGGGEYST